MGCLRGVIFVAVVIYLLLVFNKAFEKKGIDIGLKPEFQVTVYENPEYPNLGHDYVTDKIISYDRNHVRFETYKGDTTFYYRYEITDLKPYKNRKNYTDNN